MEKYLQRYLLLLALIVISIYTVCIHYYIKESAILALASDLEIITDMATQQYEKTGKLPNATGTPISFYAGRENFPQIYDSAFSEEPIEDFEPVLYGEDEGPYLYFMMQSPLKNGKKLLIVKAYHEKYENRLDRVSSNIFVTISPFLGFFFIIIFFLAVRFMFKRLYKPITAFNKWSQDISTGDLEQPIPKFPYQELNKLAALLHTSISKREDSLKKEKLFLQFASHELRTPIAIIHSNSELALRLQKQTKPSLALDRIHRASLHINKIIETLLWLSKDNNDENKHNINLQTTLNNIIKENKNLLAKKDVTLEIETNSHIIKSPRHALQITLENLIRNAFEYTPHGKISIIQIRDQITICNSEALQGKESPHGFGLGLLLVKQIAKRSGWIYSNLPYESGRKATLILNPNK